MTKQNLQKSQIVIYKTSDNEVELEVKFDGENVWLRQNQIAELFSKNRTVITKHINNIFKDKEVDKKSNVQKMHVANSDKPVNFYSLDIVLAVGYRTNSVNAIKFRQWATTILKKYLTQGYVINENRLKEVQEKFVELQDTVTLLASKSRSHILKGQAVEILSLLQSYSKSLTFLEQYDKDNLPEPKGKRAKFVLSYEEAKRIVGEIKKALIEQGEASTLFGQELQGAFAGIVGNLYQTFGKKELYPNIETKAAHLLYFVIKDHPFSDGNKRSASFLFIYFLDRNNFLYKASGERKINDNALTALALLVAVSDPREKEIMIRLIINLIA